jgi:Na+-driven multidrug efflux pump
MWLMRVPIAFLLINLYGWGLEAIWVGMAADLIVRGLLCLWRFYKRTWVHVWEQRESRLAGK